MDDVRDVTAELRRIAESEPLDTLDTTPLLERGRRGRRRRRILGVGGAVAAVAAVVAAATLLPGLGSAGEAPVAKTTTRPQNPNFEPVPGVPYGEAAADQRISQAEAERRCALQNPQEKRPLRRQTYYRVGHTAQYEIENGQKYAECTVPGGDRPKPALIATAAADPLPHSTAAQLLKCSVQSWIDLTDWKVVASDRSDELARTLLLAVSPSGRKLVECNVSNSKLSELDPRVSTAFYTLSKLGPSDPAFTPAPQGKPAEMFTAGGGGWGGGCTANICPGYNYVGWGRVSDATEVRLSIGNGPVTKIPVTNGWFAFTWVAHNKFNIKDQPKVAAYNRTGKLVRTFP